MKTRSSRRTAGIWFLTLAVFDNSLPMAIWTHWPILWWTHSLISTFDPVPLELPPRITRSGEAFQRNSGASETQRNAILPRSPAALPRQAGPKLRRDHKLKRNRQHSTLTTFSTASNTLPLNTQYPIPNTPNGVKTPYSLTNSHSNFDLIHRPVNICATRIRPTGVY